MNDFITKFLGNGRKQPMLGQSGRCLVKAADVKAADVESKRPMFESKRPIFESKQPMFHRPLFWPKAADVGLKRPMSPKCQSGRCINFDQICGITHSKGSKAADVNFLSNMSYYS